MAQLQRQPHFLPFNTRHQNYNREAQERTAAALADDVSSHSKPRPGAGVKPAACITNQLAHGAPPHAMDCAAATSRQAQHSPPRANHLSEATDPGAYRFTIPNSRAESVQREPPAVKRLDHGDAGNTFVLCETGFRRRARLGATSGRPHRRTGRPRIAQVRHAAFAWQARHWRRPSHGFDL